MKKLTSEHLAILQKQTQTYFFKGYDIYFIHGWFCAYLSSPSDSEEDLVIPMYLVLDEEKIIDENVFTKFIDGLMDMYTDLADKIYEQNKLIKPLVNIEHPNNFLNNSPTELEQVNLLNWLYGYLSGYLSIGADITEYCTDDALLTEKFFPALFTVCVCFLILNKQITANKYYTGDVLIDFNELCEDVTSMWEADDTASISDQVETTTLMDGLNNLVQALSTIFFVVRKAEEDRS